MGLAVAVYSLATMDARREAFGYYPLLHLLLMGVGGAFLTGDIFNLYVWFEVRGDARRLVRAAGARRRAGTIHHIIVKTNLFLLSGVAYRLRGMYGLKQLGGLYRDQPLVAGLFLISALSLAGMPPLSGFFAKLVLVRAGLEREQYALVATALVVGLLTLLAVTRIWAEAFWKEPPGPAGAGDLTRSARSWTLLAPSVALAALTVAIGLAAGPILALSARTAEQLLDPAGYIEAAFR